MTLVTGDVVSHQPSPQQTLAAMYDEAAAAYSEHWAPALHRHARELVAAVPPLQGGPAIVVDVAAGAGTLAGPLRALAGHGGHVLALDHSAGMLRRAPVDLPRAQADAARLPLRDAAADVVVLAFVLFLLPDARAAAVEAARVLGRGGWLLAATWGSQLDSPADTVVREEIDRAGAPASPTLPRSDELTDSPERMAELLGAAGLVDVHTSSRALGAHFDADSALALRTGSGSPGWRFRRLGPTAQQEVRARAAERLARLPEEAFHDRSEVLLTTARRP